MDTTLFYGIVIVLAVSPLLLSSFHSIRQQKVASQTDGATTRVFSFFNIW